MKMATVTMTMEEYLNLLNNLSSEVISNPNAIDPEAVQTKPKKKSTAYQRRYKRNFKKIEDNYKLKSGKWAKNGFKRAVKEAHRMSQE